MASINCLAPIGTLVCENVRATGIGGAGIEISGGRERVTSCQSLWVSFPFLALSKECCVCCTNAVQYTTGKYNKGVNL